MKPIVIVGIVLIIAGVIALASGRTADTDTDREILLRASGASRRIVSLPVMGVIAIAAGAGLVILGSRKG
jgi:hypothetical protein